MEAVGQQSADRIGERQHLLVEGLGGILLSRHSAAPSSRAPKVSDVRAKNAISLCRGTMLRQRPAKEIRALRNGVEPAGHRPIEPLFKPVVAPEDLAVHGHETRRADDSDLHRAGALGLEPRLVRLAFGALERRRRIGATRGEQGAERRTIADRQALTELGDKDLSGKVSALVAFEHERNSCGEQARVWKRLGPLERNAHRSARPLEVAPHIPALGRIDVKRRVAPTLREEDWPKQEWAPDKTHASPLRERGDPERGRIGIGARELVPELGARHCASSMTATLPRPPERRKRPVRADKKTAPSVGWGGSYLRIRLYRPLGGLALRRFGRSGGRRVFSGVFYFFGHILLGLLRLHRRVLGGRHVVGGRGSAGGRSRRVGLSDRGERSEYDRGADPDGGQCLQHFYILHVVRLLAVGGRGHAPLQMNWQ